MLILVNHMAALLPEQLMAVYRESLGDDLTLRQDFYTYLRHEFFTQPGAMLAVWKAQGIYVSALRLEPYRDGLLLTGLETHPEHRGRGYAQELLGAVLSREGKVYSHVDKRNLISLHVHQKAGFQIISDTAVYLDGSADSKCWTLCRIKECA